MSRSRFGSTPGAPAGTKLVHQNCKESHRYALSACPGWFLGLRTALPGLQDCSRMLWGRPEALPGALRGHPRAPSWSTKAAKRVIGMPFPPVLPGAWVSVLPSLDSRTAPECSGGTPEPLRGHLRAPSWSVRLECRTYLGPCPACLGLSAVFPSLQECSRMLWRCPGAALGALRGHLWAPS